MKPKKDFELKAGQGEDGGIGGRVGGWVGGWVGGKTGCWQEESDKETVCGTGCEGGAMGRRGLSGRGSTGVEVAVGTGRDDGGGGGVLRPGGGEGECGWTQEEQRGKKPAMEKRDGEEGAESSPITPISVRSTRGGQDYDRSPQDLKRDISDSEPFQHQQKIGCSIK
ncbi:hypothetical protein EYF80_007228 [Liparis tanakae]|uniref:Uncharacterized protein n=1 Tax=Liparis tanakae TaxID=230148 RepID=A0A4Z2IYY0_9TELE|nr:hypothetical protein EYF80_007228 [Liparis tanakae]